MSGPLDSGDAGLLLGALVCLVHVSGCGGCGSRSPAPAEPAAAAAPEPAGCRDCKVAAPPAAAAAPPPAAMDVSGGETDEIVIFDSTRAPNAECRQQQPIMRHLVELFAAVKCFERNHTTAGRQRFGCTEGSFLITPREKPDSAAFSIAMQWTGNVEVPLQALESAPPFTWLKGCGFTFPPPRSQAAADSLYIYQHDALCWNAASCPPHCRAASKFLSAAKLAAQAAGCTALEGDARVTFTCQGPTAREDCRRNLDGEIARFNLKKRDRDVAGQLAFTITYRGNAVETCNGSAYRPGSGEGALFGPGFPDFLIKLRDDCHPR